MKEKKHDLFREVCEQLDIKDIKGEWFSTGSTITGTAFKTVLYKIAEKTGVPPRGLSEADQLIWRLLHKSQEAMLQSLQTINNPTLIYRLESFLFLFINAWELLLKAKILDDTKDISRVQHSDQKSISIDKALNIVFTTDNNPVKENILVIEELRNEATHMIIPIIPNIAINLFQAGIFNYNTFLHDWFGRHIDEKLVGSMMFLISGVDHNTISIEKALLSKRITDEVAKILKKWENSVTQRLGKIPDDMKINQFAIPIDINVAIVKNPNKADILAAMNVKNNEDTLLAIKYQRPIDKYPFSYKKLEEEIRKHKSDVKQRTIYALIKELNIKNNEEYSVPNFSTLQSEEKYKATGKVSTNTPFIYNKKAIDFIISKL